MALEMREIIQTARAAISKTMDIVAKIEKHILPLEENKLWKDEKFFQQVKDILRNGNITEENVTQVVADALFRLHESRPEVKVVEELVQAFPDSLKIKKSFPSKLPVQEITLKAQHHIWKHEPFNPYILVLASVGAKEGVVDRGGLFDVFSKGYGPFLNVVQILVKSYTTSCNMTLLKALFEKGLLKKEDISNYNLLYYSCCSDCYGSTFQYLVDLNPKALLSASAIGSRSRFHRMTLLHALIESETDDRGKLKGFKRCLKHSLKHYPDLLFKKRQGMTALTRAQDQFKETEMMTMIRSVFTEETGVPFLHEVIIHQPADYNRFLAWFPWMNRLRDKDGRTVTQKILTSAKALRVHPMAWVNLSTDQLEEKDPATTLRPFAAIAAGKDSDLNLSYQILRQHPSVVDVIQEEREKIFRDTVMNKSKGKKRKHDG